MRFFLVAIACLLFLGACGGGGGSSGGSGETINAQNIAGTYDAEETYPNGLTISGTMTFGAGGGLSAKVGNYEGGGSWTLDRDILTIDYDHNNALITGKVTGSSQQFTHKSGLGTTVYTRL